MHCLFIDHSFLSRQRFPTVGKSSLGGGGGGVFIQRRGLLTLWHTLFKNKLDEIFISKRLLNYNIKGTIFKIFSGIFLILK